MGDLESKFGQFDPKKCALNKSIIGFYIQGKTNEFRSIPSKYSSKQ